MKNTKNFETKLTFWEVLQKPRRGLLQVTLLEDETGSTFWLNPVNMAKIFHQYAAAIINYLNYEFP
jgi:hypothetical protein